MKPGKFRINWKCNTVTLWSQKSTVNLISVSWAACGSVGDCGCWAHLRYTIRIKEVARPAEIRPAVQQQLRWTRRDWDILGRKYSSCTSCCWDSAGSSTNTPSWASTHNKWGSIWLKQAMVGDSTRVWPLKRGPREKMCVVQCLTHMLMSKISKQKRCCDRLLLPSHHLNYQTILTAIIRLLQSAAVEHMELCRPLKELQCNITLFSSINKQTFLCFNLNKCVWQIHF